MRTSTVAVARCVLAWFITVAVASAGEPDGPRGATAEAAPLQLYDEVWTSPSEDHSGSMPLGNGDLGLNAWVDTAGDIQFLISKTDAWDDNARLVKVGKVRVSLEPNLLAEPTGFQQTLRLQDATLTVQANEGPRRVTVRIWVDANHPVIHVAVESATAVSATASVELWRTAQQECQELQCSDIMNGAPAERRQPTIIEPDTVLADQAGRIGWYHHNVKSLGPGLLAEIQGLTGFAQQDPLLGRIFGAMLLADEGRRIDDQHLASGPGTSHRFRIFVLTRHPSTPADWLAEIDRTIARVDQEPPAARRAAHERWWAEFWDRSWIRARLAEGAEPSVVVAVPKNALPVCVGRDQLGGLKFPGELGRVRIWTRALSDAEVQTLAKQDRQQPVDSPPGLVFSGAAPGPIPDSAGWDFKDGLTVEVWANPPDMQGRDARLVDKITAGGSDGFLLDAHPGNSVRFICGQRQLGQSGALPAGRWTHLAAVADPAGGCRLFIEGRQAGGEAVAAVGDEAAYVSRMYHLQRFINACGGRGRHPIKFNGSIFTVPLPGGKSDPDYRRWGSGYWWQNTRLPYFSMPASGDLDLLEPLYRMYVDDVLELSKYRTRLYCGHDGAYYPECIYFWGPMFSETYGWQPWDQRQDKLQASRWHKWEWVGGLELCWLMLDQYEHSPDQDFLARRVLPTCREVLTFFDQHYETDAQGKLVMHPSQACETWWECTNPMPELAGCIAVTQRLLALPAESVPEAERALWRRLHDKLPGLPTREVDGRTALAPAEKFDLKRNIENPELYAVFPFRLIAVDKPHVEWGLAALEHRWDRGHAGWRQDDLFMAYLGLANDARKAIVSRARRYDSTQRFPAFWGPNYDWTPDQTHGGVLMRTLQAMLLQTDGRRILLLPAWPKDWEADFKLHAPQRTVVAGKIRGGQLAELTVTPPERRQDVEIVSPR